MGRPLIDGYYAAYLDVPESFDAWLGRRPRLVGRAANRYGWVRGVLLFAASVRRPVVGIVRLDRGWRSLLFLRALFGRRPKLVVLQFLAQPLPDDGWRRVAERLWRYVERPSVTRALHTGLVLTSWEVDRYAEDYRVGPGRFRHVPWPWRQESGEALPPYDESGPIVSSGRAFCDWPTLVEATRGLPWPLKIVCTGEDAVRLQSLQPSAEIVCDLSRESYTKLLSSAGLAVFAMTDGGTSQAQIRLMDANEAGAPVLASDVRGLAGYVIPDETAVLVAPGDAGALRAAIDTLMRSPQRRNAIRAAAFKRSQRWTGPDYGRAVEDVLCGREPRIPDP